MDPAIAQAEADQLRGEVIALSRVVRTKRTQLRRKKRKLQDLEDFCLRHDIAIVREQSPKGGHSDHQDGPPR